MCPKTMSVIAQLQQTQFFCPFPTFLLALKKAQDQPRGARSKPLNPLAQALLGLAGLLQSTQNVEETSCCFFKYLSSCRMQKIGRGEYLRNAGQVCNSCVHKVSDSAICYFEQILWKTCTSLATKCVFIRQVLSLDFE